MRIVSLKKLVEENNIKTVEVEVGEGVNPVSFEVGSPDYLEQKLWLVKGDFTINDGLLHVKRLEKDLNITLNPIEVTAEQNEPTEEEKKLEEYINTPVTAVYFNRHSLDSTCFDTERKHVSRYAELVVESFRKNKGYANTEDFAVFEIDWNNRSIMLKSISD